MEHFEKSNLELTSSDNLFFYKPTNIVYDIPVDMTPLVYICLKHRAGLKFMQDGSRTPIIIFHLKNRKPFGFHGLSFNFNNGDYSDWVYFGSKNHLKKLKHFLFDLRYFRKEGYKIDKKHIKTFKPELFILMKKKIMYEIYEEGFVTNNDNIIDPKFYMRTDSYNIAIDYLTNLEEKYYVRRVIFKNIAPKVFDWEVDESFGNKYLKEITIL